MGEENPHTVKSIWEKLHLPVLILATLGAVIYLTKPWEHKGWLNGLYSAPLFAGLADAILRRVINRKKEKSRTDSNDH